MSELMFTLIGIVFVLILLPFALLLLSHMGELLMRYWIFVINLFDKDDYDGRNDINHP